MTNYLDFMLGFFLATWALNSVLIAGLLFQKLLAQKETPHEPG